MTDLSKSNNRRQVPSSKCSTSLSFNNTSIARGAVELLASLIFSIGQGSTGRKARLPCV